MDQWLKKVANVVESRLIAGLGVERSTTEFAGEGPLLPSEVGDGRPMRELLVLKSVIIVSNWCTFITQTNSVQKEERLDKRNSRVYQSATSHKE